MPSDRQPALSKRGYDYAVWIGCAIATIPLIEFIASIEAFIKKWNCGLFGGGFTTDPGPNLICSAANALPHWPIALAIFFGGMVFALSASRGQVYWYEEVTEGEVVGMKWRARASRDLHFIELKGKTRNGDTRVYTNWVEPETYGKCNEGDFIKLS